MNEKIKDGLHTSWYENGYKKSEHFYVSYGIERSRSKEWNEDGSVKE